jgi:hypothetical protein
MLISGLSDIVRGVFYFQVAPSDLCHKSLGSDALINSVAFSF